MDAELPQPQRLGKALKLARIAAGLSQAQVASDLDVHETTVSAWERDRQDPGETVIGQLAALYGTTKSALRYGGTASRVSEPAPSASAGLPQRIRAWIETFLVELEDAKVSEREIDLARRALQSPDVYSFYVGGEKVDASEKDLIEAYQGVAFAISQELKRRGYKLRGK